ncbi:MAG TPA: hypothetical protein ENI46_00575, partial [Firmicutes bacterium]|nr:hypothetical protein [Bacillota bacterium]
MIRRVVAFGLLVLGLNLIAATGEAAISTFTYQVPEPELRTSGEHVYFAIDGFGSSTNPYYPVLPTRKVHFEIPYAATNVMVSVIPGGQQSLGRFDNYLMRTPPLLLGDPSYKPEQAPEKLPEITPLQPYRYNGERIFRGHHLIEIILYPLQYRTGDGEVLYTSSYTIEVTYLMATDAQASEEMARRARSRVFEPLAAEIVENYESDGDQLLAPEPPGALYDLDNPQYAIITSSTFQAVAETLAAWKTRKGVPTKVYLVSWIESNYPGYDTQEKIRNFLRLDDSTPRFDYVLLLGDTDVIPDRKCWSQDGDQVPCDYYYSDVVDGAYGSGYDWDTDNDHVWGEFDDTITWLPDIYVGRIASSSLSEVETIINNIISYEKNPPVGSWPKKVVFGSAFANYPTTDYDPTDMAAVAEHVRLDFLDGAGVSYDRLYEAAGIYPTSYTYDFPLPASNYE